MIFLSFFILLKKIIKKIWYSNMEKSYYLFSNSNSHDFYANYIKVNVLKIGFMTELKIFSVHGLLVESTVEL